MAPVMLLPLVEASDQKEQAVAGTNLTICQGLLPRFRLTSNADQPEPSPTIPRKALSLKCNSTITLMSAARIQGIHRCTFLMMQIPAFHLDIKWYGYWRRIFHVFENF